MRLVDKQILRELAAPFFFGVAAFSSVFFAGSLLLKFTNWIMDGVPILTALEIVLLFTPSIIVYTLPMAVLLAVLLGIGRLSGDSEVVALFAGGVSLYRLAVPVIGLGLAISIGAILLNEIVSPWANLRGQTLEAAVLKKARVSERPFTLKDEGTNARIEVGGGMDTATGTLKQVTIIQYAEMNPALVIYADRAQWMGLSNPKHQYRWKLYDGYLQTVGTNSPAYLKFEKSQTREVEIEKTPEQLSLYQRDPEQMSFTELTRMVGYLKKHPDRAQEDIRRMDVDRWNKLALPLSSLVFAMLALPLAIRPHRSASSVGLGLSILLILLYWLMWRYTTLLARQGHIDAVVGAFLADVLGIIFAVILMKRTAK